MFLIWRVNELWPDMPIAHQLSILLCVWAEDNASFQWKWLFYLIYSDVKLTVSFSYILIRHNDSLCKINLSSFNQGTDSASPEPFYCCEHMHSDT